MWLFLLLSVLPRFGEANARVEDYHFHYGQKAGEAYQLLLELRMGEAEDKIRILQEEDPHNLAVFHLVNYRDFLQVYISEDEKAFQAWKKEIWSRLRTVRKGPSDSPYSLYVQAEIYLQWAVTRIKFGEYIGAFNDLSTAYQLLRKNEKRFPDFLPNQKNLGMLHAFVGSLPDSYRWGFQLISGMRGSLKESRKELRLASSQSGLFQTEASIFEVYHLLYLANRPSEAWDRLATLGLDPKKSPLYCFILANVAMRTGRNEAALQFLRSRPQGGSYFPFPYLDFLEGLARLRRLDPASAAFFDRFLRDFKGRHYLKAAYQKRAWHALLFESENRYRHFMESCLQKGESRVGEDEAAWEEAQSGAMPHPELLKARLLFDGGYYGQAKVVLDKIRVERMKEKRLMVEFYYRKGRVFQEMGRLEEAEDHLKKTVRLGTGESWYFACKSALELGLMFEQAGNDQEAALWYQNCLQLSPQAYKTGLHRQARSGLERLQWK